MKVSTFVIIVSLLLFACMNANAIEEFELIPDDIVPTDGYNYSRDISGDYAIVGAWYEDVGDSLQAGSAYIFQREGDAWNQMARLTDADPLPGSKFGTRVAINGDYAFVSTPYDYDFIGHVSIFVREGNEWSFQQILTPEDGDNIHIFGYDISIDGDYAIIRALHEDYAYIYVNDGNNWTQQQRILIEDEDVRSNVRAVDITNEYAIVYHDEGLYLFEREENEWRNQAIIDDYYRFGISNNYMILGDMGSQNRNQLGEAYVYTRNVDGWEEHQQLIPSDIEENRENLYTYGRSVSIDNDWAIVGANECAYILNLLIMSGLRDTRSIEAVMLSLTEPA